MGEALTRRFRTPSGTVLAIDEVDVEIPSGRLCVVAGPSGSGKSVLLSMMSCTDRPTSGSVRVGDQLVTDLGRRSRRRFRRTRIGIVLPMPSDNLLARTTALGNVRWAQRVRAGRRAAEGRDDEARSLMEAVDVDHLANKRAHELSGGEQQRVALVCALVARPDLVVADEPTASLDAVSSAAVVDALSVLARRGTTMVVATHDHHVIDVADTVIRLDHGRRVG
ncbi:MAG TPA: ATP-binding cassette domain-containing protein [Acidimicrobiales bacterium]|nr:ATP-binding cassette domain-containing protein [Acidimicrobiales bacterium]